MRRILSEGGLHGLRRRSERLCPLFAAGGAASRDNGGMRCTRLVRAVFAALFTTLVAVLLLGVPIVAFGQTLSVLHITVALVDSSQQATPVPRHALLISDVPPSTTPRRVVTSADGSVDVRLPPGTYTVESDRSVAFHGSAYEWTETVTISTGRTTILALTAENATIEPVSVDSTALSPALETEPSLLVAQWRNSIVAVWTPTTRASGFVVATTGLIVTNQRSVGTATSVEVQLTSTSKVSGRVLIADAARVQPADLGAANKLCNRRVDIRMHI